MPKLVPYDEGSSPAGWRAPEGLIDQQQFKGYHTWQHDEVNIGGTTLRTKSSGSFEVFYATCDEEAGEGMRPCFENNEQAKGWYWWPCSPGCLPDGDPSGPFPTAEGAYLDAIGD